MLKEIKTRKQAGEVLVSLIGKLPPDSKNDLALLGNFFDREIGRLSREAGAGSIKIGRSVKKALEVIKTALIKENVALRQLAKDLEAKVDELEKQLEGAPVQESEEDEDVLELGTLGLGGAEVDVPKTEPSEELKEAARAEIEDFPPDDVPEEFKDRDEELDDAFAGGEM